MIDSDEGQVIYQMNNFGRYLAFPVYRTSEERKKQLEKLESEAKTLLNAINVGDPSIVEGIYNYSSSNRL